MSLFMMLCYASPSLPLLSIPNHCWFFHCHCLWIVNYSWLSKSSIVSCELAVLLLVVVEYELARLVSSVWPVVSWLLVVLRFSVTCCELLSVARFSGTYAWLLVVRFSGTCYGLVSQSCFILVLSRELVWLEIAVSDVRVVSIVEVIMLSTTFMFSSYRYQQSSYHRSSISIHS